MARLPEGFNAREETPYGDMSPVPSGVYRAKIVSSNTKATKSGNGAYLELLFEICQGDEFDGRQVFDRLNLDNPSETAVRIARGKLSSICRAVGVMEPQDSIELHDIPLLIKVDCQERIDNTGETQKSNEIKSYKPCPEPMAADDPGDCPIG